MKALLKHLITKTILRQKRQTDEPGRVYSKYELAKGFRELKINFLRFIKDTFFMAAGIGSAAFGLKSFLLPNSFIDGGATGISLLVSELTSIPLYVLLVLINIPFVFLGVKIIGKNFAVKTALAIFGLALCVAFIHFPEVTNDKLLVSVGGFFLGAGIGLSVRGGRN